MKKRIVVSSHHVMAGACFAFNCSFILLQTSLNVLEGLIPIRVLPSSVIQLGQIQNQMEAV